jgi:hypothetical protein
MPCRRPGQVGHRAKLAPLSAVYRDPGGFIALEAHESAASGHYHAPVTLQKRHFQAQPPRRGELPQFDPV